MWTTRMRGALGRTLFAGGAAVCRLAGRIEGTPPALWGDEEWVHFERVGPDPRIAAACARDRNASAGRSAAGNPA